MDDKRIYSRIHLNNMSVDISDGEGFFSGYIGDISQTGLRLQHISKTLDDGLRRFVIVASKQDIHFRMLVRPRWKNYNGHTKDIGVTIDTPSPEWRQFVKNHQLPTTNPLFF